MFPDTINLINFPVILWILLLFETTNYSQKLIRITIKISIKLQLNELKLFVHFAFFLNVLN